MAYISKEVAESIEKKNNKLKNGFKINPISLLVGNRQVPVRKIHLNDHKYLELQLCFRTEYENFKRKGYSVVINISVYAQIEGNDAMWQSYGLGQNIVVETGLSRRNFNALVKASEIATDDYIKDVFDEKIATNARIL